MNQKNEIEKILPKMGFKKVANNQFECPKKGTIFLYDFTLEEVANKIFELGESGLKTKFRLLFNIHI